MRLSASIAHHLSKIQESLAYRLITFENLDRVVPDLIELTLRESRSTNGAVEDVDVKALQFWGRRVGCTEQNVEDRLDGETKSGR